MKAFSLLLVKGVVDLKKDVSLKRKKVKLSRGSSDENIECRNCNAAKNIANCTKIIERSVKNKDWPSLIKPSVLSKVPGPILLFSGCCVFLLYFFAKSRRRASPPF